MEAWKNEKSSSVNFHWQKCYGELRSDCRNLPRFYKHEGDWNRIANKWCKNRTAEIKQVESCLAAPNTAEKYSPRVQQI